jgi:hypothetical protein
MHTEQFVAILESLSTAVQSGAIPESEYIQHCNTLRDVSAMVGKSTYEPRGTDVEAGTLTADSLKFAAELGVITNAQCDILCRCLEITSYVDTLGETISHELWDKYFIMYHNGTIETTLEAFFEKVKAPLNIAELLMDSVAKYYKKDAAEEKIWELAAFAAQRISGEKLMTIIRSPKAYATPTCVEVVTAWAMCCSNAVPIVRGRLALIAAKVPTDRKEILHVLDNLLRPYKSPEFVEVCLECASREWTRVTSGRQEVIGMVANFPRI